MIDELIFRSSSVGNLCGKTGLGATGEKLAIHVYLETKYGRVKEFSSKYTDKGLSCEESAINALNSIHQKQYVKNEVRICNDFITGECDIDDKESDLIIDVKNSWDLFTFHDAKTTDNKNYEFQGQCYMELYNRSNFSLIYMLEDAPDNIILKELERESYKWNGETPEWREVQIIGSMIYNAENFNRFIDIRSLGGDSFTDKLIDTYIEIPQTERMHIKSYERDSKKYDFIKSRVLEARKFLKTIYK